MNRLHLLLLSGAVILGMETANASHRLTEKQRQRLEDAQWNKLQHQRKLARNPIYGMLDELIVEDTSFINESMNKEKGLRERIAVNWQGVFKILDSMKGVISVNEYSTYEYGFPLLWLAVREGNISVAKTLLEKYKANPNVLVFMPYLAGEEEEEMFPLMLACRMENIEMINLLLKNGANPNVQNNLGKNSFCYVKDSKIIKILNPSGKF